MSHDIRTPLNGIIGLLDMEERHKYDTEMMRKNHEKMRIPARHLLALVNDVLDLSKLENDATALEEKPFALGETLREVFSIGHIKAAEDGILLEENWKPKDFDGLLVMGSALHVKRILLNILANAVKYNRPGGRVFFTGTLEKQSGGSIFTFVIEDTGIGMSEAFLEHIFEPFAQEHSDARSVFSGTGLGMSIVKNLIDRMGGVIEVASEKGKGSRFTVSLPFKNVLGQKQTVKMPIGDFDLEGCRLLLVEDNALNAEIAKTLLEDCGAKVSHVVNGAEAVKTLSEDENADFDGVLMDIMMPVMDGISAAKAIRSLPDPKRAGIPIIAMTANAFAEDVLKCREAGMNAHLAKPLDPMKVRTTLAEILNENA